MVDRGAGPRAAGPPVAGSAVMIVAIDGPSGSGKSTAARRLAERLGLPVLDTGAMYRAAALKVLEAGVDPADRQAVVEVLESTDIDLRPAPEGALEVMLDGRPVGERIRIPEVTAATSRISAYPEVRRRQVALQRRVAARQGAVVEGRDIGTVVFTDTPHKFFLHAKPEVRADRRYRELRTAGVGVARDRVLEEILERDRRDSGRQDSPLICDDSYSVIDTSELSPDEIVERMALSVSGA
ncbi:MAG: (d)CMP kinase [Thermoanaerobaculia bacterium]